ncbi:MAG: 30S ribosomal protein S16 [Phycisphaerales bacterium]
MVRIRMQRLGRKNRPFYRIAAIDQRTRRNGRVIEALGIYDPVHPDVTKQIVLDEERIKHWLSVGAQPTDTVRDMLARRGIGDIAAWEAQRAADREMVAKKVAAAAASGEAEKKA